MWELGAFVGLPLGAWLFTTGGYLLVFGTGFAIYLIACILGLNTLWGFKEKLNRDQKSLPLAGSHIINSKQLFSNLFRSHITKEHYRCPCYNI